MYSVEYGTKKILFNVERKATLKNTYISIDKDGVLVKTNRTTTMEQIYDMVRKKSAWIIKKLELFNAKSVSNSPITTGSRLYYFGKSYYIQISHDKDVKSVEINFIHSKFKITTPIKYKEIELHNAIKSFYKQTAIEKITPLAEKWSKKMSVEPSRISFRYARKRWGSCSSTRRISFNYNLVKLPSSLIEYVIVHEFAHLTHLNHSKDFWKLVYKYMNDYRVREEKIREFEKLF